MAVLVEEQAGAVRVLTLNRPEKANALNTELHLALADAFRTAAQDDSVRVVVLTGAGEKHFCAGMDLAEFADRPADDARPQRDQPWGAATFTDALYPKPVIAAVNGTAVGGGFGLVLACDIVLAVESARFGAPEVRHGLVGVGVTTRAVQRLPVPLATRLALTGDLLDSRAALDAHLVAEVVRGPDLMPRALELAAQIAGHPPQAVATLKQIIGSVSAAFDVDIAALRRRAEPVILGETARAGARAFTARRSTPGDPTS